MGIPMLNGQIVKHQPSINATSNLALPSAFAKKKGPVFIRPFFVLSVAFT